MKKVIHDINNPIYLPKNSFVFFENVVNNLLCEVARTYKGKTQFSHEYMAYIDGDAVIIKEADVREKWMRHYLDIFDHENGTYEISGNFTIVSLCGGRLGASLCGTRDSFDKDIGIAVATARAYGAEIPDYI